MTEVKRIHRLAHKNDIKADISPGILDFSQEINAGRNFMTQFCSYYHRNAKCAKVLQIRQPRRPPS